MAPLKTRPRKTIEDFMKLPEGVRAELIEGEIFMSPSPRERHQRAVLNLGALLRAHVLARNLGRVYVAPFDVHLPSGDAVQPDVLFISSARAGIIQDCVRGVPDLVGEVLSPEVPERDLIVKRDLYARNGVREYWIVDPEERAVEVLELSGKSYSPRGYFQESDTLTTPLLPGLSLRIQEVFA